MHFQYKSKLDGDQVLLSISSSSNGHDTNTKGFKDEGEKAMLEGYMSMGSVFGRKGWPHFKMWPSTQPPFA